MKTTTKTKAQAVVRTSKATKVARKRDNAPPQVDEGRHGPELAQQMPNLSTNHSPSLVEKISPEIRGNGAESVLDHMGVFDGHPAQPAKSRRWARKQGTILRFNPHFEVFSSSISELMHGEMPRLLAQQIAKELTLGRPAIGTANSSTSPIERKKHEN